MAMPIEEAIRIAEILEQDDVIGVTGLACRALLKEVQRLQKELINTNTKGFKPEEYV